MSNKYKEYLLILGIIFSLVYVFWPISELEETIPMVFVVEDPIQVL